MIINDNKGIFFLISPQKSLLWVRITITSIHLPHRGDSDEHPQHMF